MNRKERRATTRKGRKPEPIEMVKCSRESLAIAAMRADQAQQYGAAALAREAMRGDLTVVFVNDRVNNLNLDGVTDHRPVVLIIGDDDYSTTGPDGWKCLNTVVSWAASAVIHAAAATAQTYLEAARAAHLTRACVLVETDVAHAHEWAQKFIAMPTLTILPRDGVHPARPGTMQ